MFLTINDLKFFSKYIISMLQHILETIEKEHKNMNNIYKNSNMYSFRPYHGMELDTNDLLKQFNAFQSEIERLKDLEEGDKITIDEDKSGNQIIGIQRNATTYISGLTRWWNNQSRTKTYTYISNLTSEFYLFFRMIYYYEHYSLEVRKMKVFTERLAHQLLNILDTLSKTYRDNIKFGNLYKKYVKLFMDSLKSSKKTKDKNNDKDKDKDKDN